jgi:hypothetical protein
VANGGCRYNPAYSVGAGSRLLSLLDLEALISHRVTFEELPQPLEMIDKDRAACAGVAVHY